MFRFFISNAVLVSVAILIICLLGLLAVFRVPIQMIPDIEARVLTVSTIWPGATPQDIEQEILVEQEEFLRRIPGLERITARASTSRAEIELEFPLGTDINQALILVNNALSQVPSYPENVDEPRIATSSVSDNPFMFFSVRALPGNPNDIDILTQQDFVDDIVRTRLEQVAGVSEVLATGGGERQIRVRVDPNLLAERGLRLTDVRNAIRGRNRDVSGGDVDTGKRRYLVRTVGRYQSLADIENTVIARRGDAFIRLRDVGSARLEHAEIRNYAYTRSEPMIGMRLRKEIGANVVAVKAGVIDAVETLNAGVLAERGLYLTIGSDDVVYVVEAVEVVWRNLIIGATLAVLVMFLFLGSPSATFIGAMGIPICTIAAFLGLLLTGRTINVISLAGVAFAIGMTLDNNIVVLENIYRHLAAGRSRLQAALAGVTEVWPAVLASTLTTVCVFLPVLFVEDEAGQLYSDISVAIAASIVMSMVVAITLVPAASGRFLNARAPRSGPGLTERLRDRVVAGVRWLLERSWRCAALVAGVLAAALAVLVWLTPAAEYLPEGEEKKVFALMFAPPGYNIDTMREVYRTVDSEFNPYFDADPADYAAGRAPVPAIVSNVSFVNSGSVFYLVEADDRAQTDDLMRIASEKIRGVPGLIAFASRGSIFSGNSGGTRSINVDISAPDLETLFDTGFKAFLKARSLFENPQVRPDPSNLTMGQPLLEVRPDWERAAELGIDAGDLGYTVWAYSDGAFVDEFFLNDEKIDMLLYSTAGTVAHPSDIDRVLLSAEGGAMVPLSAVAEVVETVNTETIRRVDGARTVTLSIVPPRGVPLETGVNVVRRDLIQAMLGSGELGPGVQMSISGASDRLDQTRAALGGNFLVAVAIAYLLLVAVLSHWGMPLVIMLAVPIGISGGIVGLWLLNRFGELAGALGMQAFVQPFDMITMLGFLVLIGTVVNNPILIVEGSMRRLREGADSAADAITEAVAGRVRPIMMSMVTTVCGLSPLVFYPGAGTELYRGLGAIVLFGLLFSTLITLTFIPAVLALVLRLPGLVLTDRRLRPEAY